MWLGSMRNTEASITTNIVLSVPCNYTIKEPRTLLNLLKLQIMMAVESELTGSLEPIPNVVAMPQGSGYLNRRLPAISSVTLVAEWIHFTLFGIILPTIKLKVYTFRGL